MQKAVKIYWMGKPLRQVYPHATKWQVIKWKTARFVRWFVRMFAISALGVAALTAVYFYGIYSAGTTVSYVAAAETSTNFPVLDKIAKAESYNSQTCTKAIVAKGGCHAYEIGSTLIHVNANGTYDIGRFAINSTHLADAIAHGFDVYTDAGNQAYAEYLFETQGSVPWADSQSIWDR
jgi:hypothetical protein